MLRDKSRWTRILRGTKDADKVLKIFRNVSILCDVFQVSFRTTDTGVRVLSECIDRLAKIDTQLHTEVKVEEIVKVIFKV